MQQMPLFNKITVEYDTSSDCQEYIYVYLNVNFD